VLVQNEEYSRRFTEIGVDRSRIKIMGNIKSRVSVKRPSLEEWKRLRRHMSVSEDSVVVTAGCIHAGEAPVIREAIDFLASLKTDWKWIIVPRYIDDVPAIMGAIGADAVLAREPFIAKEWRTCVIGAYGVMQDLYRIADAAVVGGSFIDNGCHNVWEAAQFCIPVIWGAHYYEQRESCETLLGAGVGFTASNGTDLAEKLVRVLKTDAKSFIKSMQEFMARHASDTASIEQVIP
jgi:3-deoxy-D-manno-octulosonic-acid transferase